MSEFLLDNDIVAKTVAYDLTGELQRILGRQCGVLGTLRFVITERRLKSAPDGAAKALQRLKSFLLSCTELEPTAEEARLAANLERSALELNLSFDVGESQLAAIAILRGPKHLYTGDKRAIAALEVLHNKTGLVNGLLGKIMPFEVIILAISNLLGYSQARRRVCAARGVDKAVEICFHCHSADGDSQATITCLEGYLGMIKKMAPKLCDHL